MMTLLNQVLVLLFFALPIMRSTSKCTTDKRPKWCKKINQKYPVTFLKKCNRIGSKVQGEFCCKTCNGLKREPVVNETVTTKSVTTSTPTLTTTAMTTQYLMSTMQDSRTIHSYTLDVDRDPVENGQYPIPYSTRWPAITFNSQLNRLEVIGDWYYSWRKNHNFMTITGIFSNATDSLFHGDAYFEVVHSAKVGTLVFSGNGHNGLTQVYIITQNPSWDKIKSSEKYLSPFQNPGPYSDYYEYGVVEHEDKVYLIGGRSGSYRTGSYKNTVQVINFRNVDKLQIAQTRQWIFIENLQNAVTRPAVIYRKEKLLIVGKTGDRITCQDLQYLNLASNLTGVYAGTINCGSYDDGHYYPGIYDIVGGDVSIFGGRGARKTCLQQTASGDNLDIQWKCVPSSKSAFEGLNDGYYSSGCYTRYSNFVL